MKTNESEIMIHFLHRPGMYVRTINKDTIVVFMHGMVMEKLKEPQWTSLLTDFLEDELKIVKRAMGWSYQVEVYAKRNEQDWIDGFKDVML